MKKMRFLAPLLVAGMVLPLPASAATLTISNATLTQVNSDVAFGGCYAVLNKNVGAGCTGKTVSFDCDGKFNTNGNGSRHYATALLAFSLGKLVNVYVDNTQKYGGVCVAKRIAVLK